MGEVIASNASNADRPGAVAIGALDCDATAKGAIVSGRRVVNDQPLSHAHGDGVSRSASPQNRTYHLFRDGTMAVIGPLRIGFSIEAFGAFFPNPTGVAIEPGNLMMLNPDGSVALCPNATDIFGVSVKKCAIIVNGEPFCWKGRYMKDEFENVIMEDYYDTDDQSQQQRPKESPNYNAMLPYVPRIERPKEWTVVALSGMVPVRCDDTVRVGDRIWSSTVPGVGKKTTNAAVLKAAVQISPFNAAKGYGVFKCVIGASV